MFGLTISAGRYGIDRNELVSATGRFQQDHLMAIGGPMASLNSLVISGAEYTQHNPDPSVTARQTDRQDYDHALCVAFAEFAGDSLERWQRVTGCRVRNYELGEGTIGEVSLYESSGIRIWIEFAHLADGGSLRKFTPDAFGEPGGFFTDLQLPAELRELLEPKAERIRLQWHATRMARGQKKERSELEAAVRQASSQGIRNVFAQPHLTTEDIHLASLWLTSEEVREQISHLSDDSLRKLLIEGALAKEDEIGRVLSARAAEKTAIEFFEGYRFAVEDVSITQLRNPEVLDWRTHDLLVNGRPIDVKNARRSRENWNRYVEHCVPAFKRSRIGDDVWVIGVLSPYLWPRSILAPETVPESWKRGTVFLDGDSYNGTNKIVVLGLCNEAKMKALQRHFSKPDVLEIDFARYGFPTLKFLPPWLYDYPKIVYRERDTALAQIKRILANDPGSLREFGDSGSAKISLLLVADLPVETDYDLTTGRHKKSFVDTVSRWRSDQGLSLPYLYLSIVGHFLQVLASGDLEDFSPAMYRSVVFGFPHQQLKYDRPMLIFDPLRTIWELINTLESLWRANDGSIRTYRRFALRGPGILQGRESMQSAWKSLVAYCGFCGYSPLILGSQPHCESCWKLICSNCRFCSSSCPNNETNQRKHIDTEPPFMGNEDLR